MGNFPSFPRRVPSVEGNKVLEGPSAIPIRDLREEIAQMKRKRSGDEGSGVKEQETAILEAVKRIKLKDGKTIDQTLFNKWVLELCREKKHIGRVQVVNYFCKEFNVSREETQKAVKEAVDEGIIMSDGKRIFISKSYVIECFVEIVRSKGTIWKMSLLKIASRRLCLSARTLSTMLNNAVEQGIVLCDHKGRYCLPEDLHKLQGSFKTEVEINPSTSS